MSQLETCHVLSPLVLNIEHWTVEDAELEGGHREIKKGVTSDVTNSLKL
jgi:hypothetical protein